MSEHVTSFSEIANRILENNKSLLGVFLHIHTRNLELYSDDTYWEAELDFVYPNLKMDKERDLGKYLESFKIMHRTTNMLTPTPRKWSPKSKKFKQLFKNKQVYMLTYYGKIYFEDYKNLKTIFDIELLIDKSLTTYNYGVFAMRDADHA